MPARLKAAALKVWRYLVNLLYALDLLANALFWGERYETLSARWGSIQSKVRLWYWVCRTLHWFDKEHCEKSVAHHARIKSLGGE